MCKSLVVLPVFSDVFSERLPLGKYDDLPLGGKDSPWGSVMISPWGERLPLGEYDGLPLGGKDSSWGSMTIFPVGGKTPLGGV
jgi:hypothetical protein